MLSDVDSFNYNFFHSKFLLLAISILYAIKRLYFPHAKFQGITFDHKLTFKKHFEDILERSKSINKV